MPVGTSLSAISSTVLVSNASGVGTFLITGTSTSPAGQIKGNNIKFVNTTANDVNEIYLADLGMRMDGPVKVSAPTGGSTVAIFYG